MRGFAARAAPALLLALLGKAAAARAEDSIRLEDGRTIACEILQLGRSEVTFREGGKENALEYSKIASWTLDAPPARLRQGDAAFAARDFEGALTAYRGALSEIESGKAREVHRQFVYQKVANAAGAAGDVTAALEALKSLRERCGDCRLRSDSYAQGIDLARSVKDRAPLEALLLEMRGEPEPLRGRADLELARARYEASSFEEALARFADLAGRKDQPYAPEAAAWRIRTLAALERAPDLVALARATLEEKDAPPALIQAAGSALGEALLPTAKPGSGDRKAVREAYLAFAKAISAGPPAGGAGIEEYSRALVGAARASLRLAGTAAKDPEKQALRRRAAGYWAEATGAWSKSDAVKAAAKELAELDRDPAAAAAR